MASSFGIQALTIEKLTVRADRVVARVRVNPGAPRVTTPALAARIVRAHPTLPLHSCVNEKGDTFAVVIECTSLPHVLEHLVIDEQVRAETQGCLKGEPASQVSVLSQAGASPSPSPHIYTGTTRWLDETAGVAEVSVSFANDLVALRAFQSALRTLNELTAR